MHPNHLHLCSSVSHNKYHFFSINCIMHTCLHSTHLFPYVVHHITRFDTYLCPNAMFHCSVLSRYLLEYLPKQQWKKGGLLHDSARCQNVPWNIANRYLVFYYNYFCKVQILSKSGFVVRKSWKFNKELTRVCFECWYIQTLKCVLAFFLKQKQN